jgi:hypothetical protein
MGNLLVAHACLGFLGVAGTKQTMAAAGHAQPASRHPPPASSQPRPAKTLKPGPGSHGWTQPGSASAGQPAVGHGRPQPGRASTGEASS